MILISGRFGSYAELWFDEQPPGDCRADVLMYRMRPNPPDRGRCQACQSLASDLTKDADALMASFGGTNRYKIKRAASKDALTADFIVEPSGALEAFTAFYDAFAQQKGLPAAYRRGLGAACEAGQLVLASASHGEERIVWHAYVRYGASAALLHSASHFRGDGIDRALVGRANRWLHWKDMLGFKALGLARYDWGGMFDDESRPEQASINNFKREFGGEPVQAYNCAAPRTLKGHALRACGPLLERFTGG